HFTPSAAPPAVQFPPSLASVRAAPEPPPYSPSFPRNLRVPIGVRGTFTASPATRAFICISRICVDLVTKPETTRPAFSPTAGRRTIVARGRRRGVCAHPRGFSKTSDFGGPAKSDPLQCTPSRKGPPQVDGDVLMKNYDTWLTIPGCAAYIATHGAPPLGGLARLRSSSLIR